MPFPILALRMAASPDGQRNQCSTWQMPGAASDELRVCAMLVRNPEAKVKILASQVCLGASDREQQLQDQVKVWARR